MKNNTRVAITEACFLFVDLIDSSEFSLFVGAKEYASWILDFQLTFERLARKYFGVESYVNTAGDEGFAFIPKWVCEPEEAIVKAIYFVFELKTLVRINAYKSYSENLDDLMPHGLQLAAGIHAGSVTYTNKSILIDGKNRNVPDKYIGYNINYAKRVETCSREGMYSHVFLSKEAFDLVVSKKPIFFEKHRLGLKGIEKAMEIYEVRSLFVYDEPMRELMKEEYFQIINEDCVPFNGPITRKENWFISYKLSMLYQILNNATGVSNIEHYKTCFKQLLFQRIKIDDPVVEFVQSMEYEANKDITLSINKLKNVLNKYPEFIYGKVHLLENLINIQKKEDRLSGELVYLSDTIKELLKYFSPHLTEDEKRLLQTMDGNVRELIESFVNKIKTK